MSLAKAHALYLAALTLSRRIYVNTVQAVRKTHGHAVLALGLNILQAVLMVFGFYAFFVFTGIEGIAIRGDFLLYVMSGVFIFMTHVKTVGAVVYSDGPTSTMMYHRPMSTTVAICSEALAALYIQSLSIVLILSVYHLFWVPIDVQSPVAALGMFLVAWASGVAIGLGFLALRPWFPGLVQVALQLYQRINLFASGKFFVANTMPSTMLSLLDWNPLFHIIDQTRGFIFVNYNPHFSSIAHPIYVSLACLAGGLMGEYYTRRRASYSWSTKR